MADKEATSTLMSGLAGRCFMIRDDQGRCQYQGIVHCVVPSQQGDLVLVQYFEALMGFPNTMALIPLASMIETPKAADNPKRLSGFVFFTNDAHLRDYYETYQQHRDKEALKAQ